MAQLRQLGVEQKGQEAINWKLCLLCQSEDQSKEHLIHHPRLDSYQKILDIVNERASLNDGNYVEMQLRLKGITGETLCEKQAFWHRSCYQGATNKDHIQRARDRHKYALSTGSYIAKTRGRKRRSIEIDEPGPPGQSSPFTRSCTMPLDRNLCFFCQEDTVDQLFKVCTQNAGETLRSAVEHSKNPEFRTRLNACISPMDAHAIDVRYHKTCWRKHVFHATRDQGDTQRSSKVSPLQTACLIELINLIDVQTQNQAYLSMEDIETTYRNMLGADGMQNHQPAFTRQWLKDKVLSELPSVKSVLQKNRRKPAVLYSPSACEEDMVHSAITSDESIMGDMKTIFKAAQLIRKSIADFSDEKPANAIPVLSNTNDVPYELYTMIRWIMVGPVDDLETETRTSVVDRMSLTLSQNVFYGFKSNRQAKYKPSRDLATFRQLRTRENPQVLGLALTVHHDTRNKTLMNLLNAQGYCVSHGRTLLLETALANAVVENTRQFQGLYVPRFLKKGTFVFFAADNVDFAEDTADGKGTTHGTIVAVYQKADAPGEPLAPPLTIYDTKSLSVTPHHVQMMQCDKPKPQQSKRTEQFVVNKDGISGNYQLTHLGWIIASALARLKTEENSCKIPCWAGYNSLLSESKPITQIGALPLLPEVAHEWSTLLTVIMQTSQLRWLAVGEQHPTVISFDMALYEKVVQLLDARPDLKRKVVPRLGELHAVMAALRALGTSIENSGIDDAWIEADVYGSATTRQILKCTHYKRSLQAHIYSYVALYEMVLEEFFKENPNQREFCWQRTEQVEAACSEDKSAKAESVKQANTALTEALTSAEFVKSFKEWEAQKATNAMFRSIMNYLHRVETILFFVAASRNADLALHLQAAEALSKLFFAFDRIKYKRLWPRYIADMHDLRTNHPDTWKELEASNLSVTRNNIPFVSIGADHACEHLNKQMKVHSGLTGISNNANARQRFFMVTPELSCLSSEFKSQFGIGTAGRNKEHPGLGSSKIRRDHVAIGKIKAAILSHGNPVTTEGDKLYNMITHAYVPQEYVQQILNIDDTGQKLYENYVSERINGEVSLWSPVKKENNKMFMSGNKKSTVKTRNKTIDLRETKDLYGRLLVLARSNREIDQKQAIGNYEFTQTPRALFAPSGNLLPCTGKSNLIHLLEKMAKDQDQPQAEGEAPVATETPNHSQDPCRKIALVDGMVVVQKLTKKPATVVTVNHLSEWFYGRLSSLTRDYDEVILVFDTYKADSLKHITRERRRQGKDPVQYQIKDNTNIKNIPMSRLLSHDQTKADLTEYLASKTLEYSKNAPKLVIASAAGHTHSNSQLHFEDNNHEEADTLLIHHAVLASRRNPSDAQLTFFTPDTDVLVLVVANYEILLKNTSVSMASGILEVEPIWAALGADRAKALPAFHAFTGADNTGRFSRIGKGTWLKIFLKADDHILKALQMLSHNNEVTEDLVFTLAKFVCAAYSPKGIQIENIPELRWHLFCKHMAESEKLPPTLGALKQHVLRAHIQARVWGQADVAQQEFLNPLQNGYYKDDTGRLKPITTESLPAPEAIIEMVKCQCKSDCSSRRCSCNSQELPCTELCQCGTDCQNDEDSRDIVLASDSDDDSEGDDDV